MIIHRLLWLSSKIVVLQLLCFQLYRSGNDCVSGIGSMTDFLFMIGMLFDATMRSGLYPFFLIAIVECFL